MIDLPVLALTPKTDAISLAWPPSWSLLAPPISCHPLQDIRIVIGIPKSHAQLLWSMSDRLRFSSS